MRAKQNRKVKISNGEKMLYFSAFACLMLTLVLKIFCGANIGNLNMTVEKIKYDITIQEKKNESLTMKVNELTAFDKIKDVVKEMGLAYNNDNIIIINK